MSGDYHYREREKERGRDRDRDRDEHRTERRGDRERGERDRGERDHHRENRESSSRRPSHKSSFGYDEEERRGRGRDYEGRDSYKSHNHNERRRSSDRRNDNRDHSYRNGRGGDYKRDNVDGRQLLMDISQSNSSSNYFTPTLYQKDAFAALLREEEKGRDRIEPENAPDGFKSRWGIENERINIPGLPTSLPSDLSNDQIENYIIHMRIEELGRKLRIGDYIPAEKHSLSPEPSYGPDGKRNNTRDLRYKKKVEDERHALVELGMRTIMGFRPPADYKRPAKLTEKLYIPQIDFPDINFIGLLIGPRGHTLKKMESETGTKISIRGKGSVKEGKSNNQPGEDDDLHAIITGDTEDRVKACIAMINKIVETATLVPEGQNELKRSQLRELASLNGTLRDEESQMCTNCGSVGHRRFECPEAANFTASTVCRICGGVGHIARDCLQKNDPAALQAASRRNQNMDEEYANLMAELGGGKAPQSVAPTPWVAADNAIPPWQQQPMPGLGGWMPQQVEGGMFPPMPPNGFMPPPPGSVPAPPPPGIVPAPPSKPSVLTPAYD